MVNTMVIIFELVDYSLPNYEVSRCQIDSEMMIEMQYLDSSMARFLSFKGKHIHRTMQKQ